jgi:hypothetical protein
MLQCADLLLLKNVPSFLFQSLHEKVCSLVYVMMHINVSSLELLVTAQSAADRLHILSFYRK